MKLEIWTAEKSPRFDRFLGTVCSKHGLRYENLTVVTQQNGWCPKEGTVHLALGRRVFDALVSGDSITHLRGSVWENQPKDSYTIYTYSPLDRVMGEGKFQNLFNADLSKQVIWWKDCQKAIRIYKDGYKKPTEKFIIEPTLSEILAYCEEHERKKSLLAIDLETIGWKDTIQPFLFGMAHNTEEGICIPLLGRYRETIWTPGELTLIKEALEKVLTSCPQVYQNALFDVKVLRQNGYVFPLENVKHDTMLLHHTLDSALPHTLDFITSVYGMTPYWKDTLKQAPEKLSELPLEESSTYNLRDCVTLHQILPPMLEELREESLEQVYYDEAMAGVPAALEQMETGIYLSHSAIDSWRAEITKEVKKLEKQLYKLWPLPKSFKLTSSDHLAWLVANQPLPKFEELEGLKDFEESPKQAFRCSECNRKFWSEKNISPKVCTKCGAVTFNALEEFKLQARKKKLNNKGQTSGVYQNLLDLEELAKIPRFYNGRFKIKLSRKTKKRILDKAGRQKLLFDAVRWLDFEETRTRPNKENIKNLRTMVEWIKLYDEWAHREKQRSTYTTFPTWGDGKMHYNILLHGTETGRIAARDVNILNQPVKKEPRLGECYVAPRGWKVVSMDYSNLEARVMAYVVQDPLFIEAVESGNLHDINTKALFHIDETSPAWKAGRGASKIFQFGKIQYGGGDRTIYEKVYLAAPQLGLTFEEFQLLTDRYFDTYKVFGEWRIRTEEETLRTRKTYTAFGRVRNLYGHEHEIVKQAYNFPSQGTAAGVMNRVQAEALRVRDDHGLRARLQVQIYDDLRWLCPDEEVDTLVGLIRPVMEQPFDIFGVRRSFPVDCEVGQSWGVLKKYKGVIK